MAEAQLQAQAQTPLVVSAGSPMIPRKQDNTKGIATAGLVIAILVGIALFILIIIGWWLWNKNTYDQKWNVVNGSTTANPDTFKTDGNDIYFVKNLKDITVNVTGASSNMTGVMFEISNVGNTGVITVGKGTNVTSIVGSAVVGPGLTGQFIWSSQGVITRLAQS